MSLMQELFADTADQIAELSAERGQNFGGGEMLFPAEGTELAGTSETRQAETYQRQLEAAEQEGDQESANYYRFCMDRARTEISFGNSREGFSDGHSESYWLEKAGKEYAKNGKTASYDLYIKRAGEAHAAGKKR